VVTTNSIIFFVVNHIVGREPDISEEHIASIFMVEEYQQRQALRVSSGSHLCLFVGYLKIL
jgi:hypothetical protein